MRNNILITISFFALTTTSVAMAQNQTSGTNFTGNVSVKRFTDARNGLDCSVGSVSFEPGARTNWHAHGGGQILLITEGTAFYQEKDKPKQILHQGDVVTCLPNIEHWHGASPDSRMTHTAIGPNADKGAVVWLGKVNDDVYLGSMTAAVKKNDLSKRQQSISALAAIVAK